MKKILVTHFFGTSVDCKSAIQPICLMLYPDVLFKMLNPEQQDKTIVLNLEQSFSIVIKLKLIRSGDLRLKQCFPSIPKQLAAR
jgi:hypothetical protein